MSVLIDYLATTALDPNLLGDLMTDPERALSAAGIDPADLMGPDPKPQEPQPDVAVATVTPF